MRWALSIPFVVLVAWGAACSSSTSAVPADCQSLAKRCALCPAGDLKTGCENTAKNGNAEACKTQASNKDLTDICVDTSPDGGGSSGSSGTVTDPCGVLGPLCAKCSDGTVKQKCEDAVRATEPAGCRTFLEDPVTKSTCK